MDAAPDGTIVRREATRPDLIAFEVRNRITEPDIEWMAAIADEAMNEHEKIDMLIVMANYEGSELGAMFDSYATRVQVRSLSRVRRYAVVGAPVIASAMIEASGWVTPVETKTFDLADEAAAWEWLDDNRLAGSAAAAVV